MSATQQLPPLAVERQPPARPWPLSSRVAFRFFVIYIGLYCLTTQVIHGLFPFSFLPLPNIGTLTPIRLMVTWTARQLFHYHKPLVFMGSGSGDKAYDWVLLFLSTITAIVGTIIWSILDRRRHNYDAFHRWFRLFLRFALAGQLLMYGLVKIFPMQMPFPFLARLLEPFGDFSPMGVLWSSVGASPAYERFVGSAELLAGLLLIVPATSMLGALIALIDSIEIFTLNMTYDVPVKILSFHMILMAAFLLIPHRKRLFQFCFSNCSIEPVHPDKLFRTPHASRIAVWSQIAFGSLLLMANLYGVSKQWSMWGGGATKSPLYGIWNVDRMSIDGAAGHRCSPIPTACAASSLNFLNSPRSST